MVPRRTLIVNPEILNNYINGILDENYSGLTKSMKYSLCSGGKRIRPILTLEFARICGIDEHTALPIASSVELIHTYSLIHDDLPCMDNDDLRRGKPTNHILFGECTATLAGDALQPLAFELIMDSKINDSNKVACAKILAEAAGYKGMCGGQYLDMIFEGTNLNESQLTDINSKKTGALISCACKIGVAAATLDDELINAAGEFGFLLGQAFQIRDDILDEGEEGKNTYLVLLGKDKCTELIHELSNTAIEKLSVFKDTDNLKQMVIKLENRIN